MALEKYNYARHKTKSSADVAANDNSSVAKNRAIIAKELLAHFTSGIADAWKTLPAALSKIMKVFKPTELFEEEKLNPASGTYTKEVEAVGDKVNIAFFAFAPKAVSRVHDHRVDCVSYVIDGPIVEELFKRSGHYVDKVSEVVRVSGSVVSDLKSEDKDKFVHRVKNPFGKTGYTMHIYNCSANENPNDIIYDDKHIRVGGRSML